MFKSVNIPMTAKPTGTTSGSGSSGGSGDGSTVTLAQLGGVPIALIGVANGIPQLDSNKKVNQEYLDVANTKTILTREVTTSISSHRVIVFDVNDVPVYADNNTPSHINRVVGLSINAAGPGEELNIQHNGEIKDPSFNFTPGPIFVGEDGHITTVVPTDADAVFLQQIGIATSATAITLNILSAYRL